MKHRLLCKGVLFLVSALVYSQVPQQSYVNFEGAQLSPIRLSPDGSRLFAVNTADARLSVFDLANPSLPSLIAEIPVGLEPVSVNALSNDEAWVVNQASDSVSVVSVSSGIVTDTIQVKDEPADVVFAGPFAFVSVARSNEVRVFNRVTHALVKSISLMGLNPRALAIHPEGTFVYAAFELSGNRTTLTPVNLAPPQPPPTNPELPPAPEAPLIVDSEDPEWKPLLPTHVVDHDIAEISVGTLNVTRYISGVGTINFAMAFRPGTEDLYVANTDANNLVRFEPTLRQQFIQNRVTLVNPDGTATPLDLNASGSTRATAIAQPVAIEFDPSGLFMYIAGFGTDRIAITAPDGQVVGRIDLGPGPVWVPDSRNMRGPRGLALHSSSNRLYVMNRISNTLSIVNTATRNVIREIPVGSFDPTPDAIRQGRGFLYDAKLSGNGSASCAGCHVDAEMDLLAWDLGDPGGSLQVIQQGEEVFEMHPMKGPMTTQSLRGLLGLEPYHWRGDRADFAAFNPAFEGLMGGSQLSAQDMQAYTDFINTVTYMPNPNQNLDRTLPAEFAGGDPLAGFTTFTSEPYNIPGNLCTDCHSLPFGTNREIRPSELQPQSFKVAHLRNLYQKVGLEIGVPAPESVGGFGFLHAGTMGNLEQVLSLRQFARIRFDEVRKRNLAAFLMCFDTGMAPAVGYSRTISDSNALDPGILTDWALLENQAASGNIELIVKGAILGAPRGLLYDPGTATYTVDRAGNEPVSRTGLLLLALNGNTFTVMGVPPGTGQRMAIDRDLDGTLDGDE